MSTFFFLHFTTQFSFTCILLLITFCCTFVFMYIFIAQFYHILICCTFLPLSTSVPLPPVPRYRWSLKALFGFSSSPKLPPSRPFVVANMFVVLQTASPHPPPFPFLRRFSPLPSFLHILFLVCFCFLNLVNFFSVSVSVSASVSSLSVLSSSFFFLIIYYSSSY